MTLTTKPFTSILVCLFLLHLLFTMQIAKAQMPPSKHLISRVDFVFNSEFNNKGGSGTIKYDYDVNNKLIGLTLFDKVNLNNVMQITIRYEPNKIIIKDPYREQTLITDEQGRIISGNYISPTTSFEQLFPNSYKLNYLNGYLSRINAYDDTQLYQIDNLYYYDGNLTSINITYNSDQRYKGTQFGITYYDKPNTIDLNFIFGIYLQAQTERFPLFGFPGNLIGNQPKNLVNIITSTKIFLNNSQTTTTYKLSYAFNPDGLVNQINITHPTSSNNITTNIVSTFNITYKN